MASITKTTYGRRGDEWFVRAEVWEPADHTQAGATELQGQPGLWRLGVVVGGIPDDAKPASAEQYTAAIADLRAAQERRAAEQLAAASEQRAADYGSLRNIGVPADLAARLSGHTTTTEATT